MTGGRQKQQNHHDNRTTVLGGMDMTIGQSRMEPKRKSRWSYSPWNNNMPTNNPTTAPTCRTGLWTPSQCTESVHERWRETQLLTWLHDARPGSTSSTPCLWWACAPVRTDGRRITSRNLSSTKCCTPSYNRKSRGKNTSSTGYQMHAGSGHASVRKDGKAPRTLRAQCPRGTPQCRLTMPSSTRPASA